jgi:hypothetical protein
MFKLYESENSFLTVSNRALNLRCAVAPLREKNSSFLDQSFCCALQLHFHEESE